MCVCVCVCLGVSVCVDACAFIKYNNNVNMEPFSPYFRLMLDPKTLSYKDRDVDLVSRDGRSSSAGDNQSISLERAVTFHGTVGRADSDSLPSRHSHGSISFRETPTQRPESTKHQSRYPKPPKTAPTVMGGSIGLKDDFMKNIMLRKCKRVHKPPLEERLEDFYSRLDETMAAEEEELLRAQDKEAIKHKWTLLTKGVKAAFALGSKK